VRHSSSLAFSGRTHHVRANAIERYEVQGVLPANLPLPMDKVPFSA